MKTLLGHLAEFGSFVSQGELLCTQGLAYLLMEHPDARLAFANELAARTGVNVNHDLTWRAEEIQEIDGGRPDLQARISDKTPIVKVEAKLGARLDPGQLRSYLTHLQPGLQSRQLEGILVVLVPPLRTNEATDLVKKTFGVDGPSPWRANDYPDIVVGCTGGGSNFSGISFPFIGAQLRGGKKVRVVAVEPAACPSLTKGRYAYDFGDTGKMTPLTKMHTLGSSFMPPGFHAGGLRYHGMAPLVSHLKELGLIEARAVLQTQCFEAGVFFARHEGILPAPEANHAVKGAIDEAVRCKEEGVSKAILFNLCGHGHFDMQAYTDYFADNLTDQTYDEGELAMALAGLPSVP